MVIVDRVGRVRRWARAGLVLAAAWLAASCSSDRSSLGPIAPGHARLSLAPRFATVAGAPVVLLSRIEGSLTSPAGDSTFAKADFVEGQASLTFDVTLTGEGQDFILDLVGFDANGNEAYRAHQVYRIKPGLNDDLEQPVLNYSAPDSKAVALQLSATTTTLDAGATTKIGVAGIGPNEAPITPIRVGFTSRNTDVATVDDNGDVTAKQLKGTTYIVARTPANLADSMMITTRGAVSQVVATPTSLAMFRGATATVAAEVRDPSGNVITDRPATFATSNGDVASVSAAGIVTALGIGSANITVTVEGKTATVLVSVATPVASIALSPSDFTLSTLGATQALTATLQAKPGTSVAGLVPSFTSSDETKATVSANGTVTAVNFGKATITATIDGVSASASVTVQASALTLSPATAEKLPKGTQQFTVTPAGIGPLVWQIRVNGVVTTDAAFGTISATGFYTAPDAVPSPASFDVCAVVTGSSSQGCARITINPVPTSGADVVVLNDINMFDADRLADVNNQRLVMNLVSYTGPGPRAAQTEVVNYIGHGSLYGPRADLSPYMQGYTLKTVQDATITSIPSTYKVFIIWTPGVAFSNAEINLLKQFSAEGGRIVFIGENSAAYQAQFPIENAFLTSMGAKMTNAGGQFDCGNVVIPQAQLVTTHQVMAGLTQLTVACASEVIPGPNDFVLFRSSDGNHVLGGVAKIDVTPLPVTSASRVPAAPRLNATATAARPEVDPTVGSATRRQP